MPRKRLTYLMSNCGYFCPFLALLLSHLFFDFFDFKQLSSYFFLLIFLISFQAILKSKSVYFVFLILNSILFSLTVFLEIGHWSLFKQAISEASVHIVLESPKSEMSEFLQAYLKPELSILAGVLIICCLVGLVYTIRHFPIFLTNVTRTLKRLIYTGLLISFSVILILRFSFLPYIALRASYTFHKERQALYETDIKKYGNFKKVSQNPIVENETVVILIGESTTRSHMSLYGYERATNPLLANRKETLVIYNQVSSPHSHTIESLGKALTLGNYNTPSKKFNSTIIQLFNSANYKTYWISNQKPFGMYESSTRLISKMSDQSVFTKMTNVMLDEIVIQPLQNALQEKANKKFIIVHLMGTHSVYSNRYSPQFDVFKSNPTTKFKHKEAYTTINEYDNAVLYNDYIVNTIIDAVKKQNESSYLLYFSDHGEDVYETIDQACHTEDIGTKPMFEVPFVLWFSEKYANSKNDLVLDPSRIYNIRELIHTVANLSNLTFSGYQPERSIVNSSFDEQHFKN